MDSKKEKEWKEIQQAVKKADRNMGNVYVKSIPMSRIKLVEKGKRGKIKMAKKKRKPKKPLLKDTTIL